MTSSYKAPPMLNEDTSYERWKKELSLWEICTEVPVNKRAAVVCLSLKGKARDIAVNIDVASLQSDDGIKALTDELDELFLKDEDQRKYAAYENFEKFKRPSDMSIAEYIVEFEKKNTKLVEYDIDLPDAVKAYRLLDSANIPKDKGELARATLTKLTYDNMKKQLLKIFDSVITTDKKTPIKEEDAFYEEGEIYYEESGSKGNKGEMFYEESGNNGSKGEIFYERSGNARGRGYYRGRFNRGFNRGRGRGFSIGNAQGKRVSFDLNTRKKNPRNSVCGVCQSIYHYARDCPDKGKKDANQDDNMSLFNNEIQECYLETFLMETLNKAILDSGCINTVAGREWIDNYLKCLDEKDRLTVKIMEQSARFRFGDGEVKIAKEKMTIPAWIKGKRITIDTFVVDSSIPLLLSKTSMRKGKTTIDFKANKARICGQNIDLSFTISGHYYIDLLPPRFDTLAAVSLKDDDKEKVAIKLHRQFGHATGEKLVKLLNDSGNKDKKLHQAVMIMSGKCKTCNRYKKAVHKPIVALPIAKEFNESVAMDLKFVDSKPILHLIDHSTRYSAASVIKSKHRDVVISRIFDMWIMYFGAPQQILSDLGGEFTSDDFRAMGEQLNTTVKTTAAESPWSNGINERHNAILGNMIEKIREDTKCSLSIAVASAVSSKNALANVYGYSPNQLVFGKNPNLPSNLINKLPALEKPSQSEVVQEKLSCIHAARKAFMEAEASEKVSRALKYQTRNTNPGYTFESGQSVYFKRNDSNRWHGPGKVVGVDGQIVVIKNGARCVSVHSCRVRHENSEFGKPEKQGKVGSKVLNDSVDDKLMSKDCENVQNEGTENENHDYESDESDEETGRNYEHGENEDDEYYEYGEDEYDDYYEYGEGAERHDEYGDYEDDYEYATDVLNYEHEEVETNDESALIEHVNENSVQETSFKGIDQNETSRNVNEDSVEEASFEDTDQNETSGNVRLYSSVINPALKSTVKYKLKDSDSWKIGEVHSRGGKVSGKYCNWFNVKNVHSGDIEAIDWKEKIEAWHPIDIEPVWITGTKLDDLAVDEAKAKELLSWQEHNVYTEVANEGQTTISTRWVCTTKDTENGKTYKARLVVRGFEEDTSEIRKDSPTCNKESFRLILAVVASNKWTVNSLDVQAAFLQGNELERCIYIKPPKEAKTNGIWQLNKGVYGLNDASRLWYVRLISEFERLGMTRSKLDNALFYYHYEGKLIGVATTHVDDVVWAGTKYFEDKVIKVIKQTFKISRENRLHFVYLGLCLEQKDSNIQLHQKEYSDQLKSIEIVNRKNRKPTDQLSKLVSHLETNKLSESLTHLIFLSWHSLMSLRFCGS